MSTRVDLLTPVGRLVSNEHVVDSLIEQRGNYTSLLPYASTKEPSSQHYILFDLQTRKRPNEPENYQ